MVRLSKSKILTYLDCPRKFKYRYIDKTKTSEPEEGSPLKIGIDVHELYEWYYKHPDAPHIDSEESIKRILAENPLSSKYPLYAKNFIEFNMELFNELGAPAYLPENVELYLHDPYFDIHGYIDAVFDSPAGKIIVDYKTGREHPIGKYSLELLMYKILYERVAGDKVGYVGAFFPKGGNKWRMAKIVHAGENNPKKGAFFTIEDEFIVLETIDQVRERIKDNEFDPPDDIYKKKFMCNYCEYKDLCKKEGVNL